MKSTILIKLLIDIAMLLIFILLMFGFNISGLFHEVFGIILIVLLILHIFLNISRIKGLKIRFNKRSIISIFQALTDITLIISMLVSEISGIAISQIIFKFNYNTTLFSLHFVSSYICLGILILHVVDHLKYIKAVSTRITFLNNSNSKKMLARFIALIFAILFVFVLNNLIFSKNNYNKTTSNYNLKDVIGNDNIEKQTSIITLDEYLDQFKCEKCGRNCSLAAPQCGKGYDLQDEAKREYKKLYSDDMN